MEQERTLQENGTYFTDEEIRAKMKEIRHNYYMKHREKIIQKNKECKINRAVKELTLEYLKQNGNGNSNSNGNKGE